MSNFTDAIGVVLSHESGVPIPDDNGRGPSKWGITLKTAKEFYPNCSANDILAMTPQRASMFYRMAFWDRYHVGLINDQSLATELLDLAVNMGGGTAVMLLQRAVGVPDDGILGPVTAAKANTDAGSTLAALKQEAAQHYRNLAIANPALVKDLQGWLNRLGA